MALSLEEMEEQALALPAESRHRLAVSLWSSLEDAECIAGEFSEEQLAEFRRRSEDLRSGKIQGIPWEDVQKEMDALF